MADRIPVIAGNWKMNTDVESGQKLAREILVLSNSVSGVEKIVCAIFHNHTSGICCEKLRSGAIESY